jgi:hypothetical protein
VSAARKPDTCCTGWSAHSTSAHDGYGNIPPAAAAATVMGVDARAHGIQRFARRLCFLTGYKTLQQIFSTVQRTRCRCLDTFQINLLEGTS